MSARRIERLARPRRRAVTATQKDQPHIYRISRAELADAGRDLLQQPSLLSDRL